MSAYNIVQMHNVSGIMPSNAAQITNKQNERIIHVKVVCAVHYFHQHDIFIRMPLIAEYV